MRIRSITSFFDPKMGDVEKTLTHLSALSNEIRKRCEGNGYEVQSTRVATTPFPTFLEPLKVDKCISQTISLEKMILKKGWSNLSLGPAFPDSPASFTLIPTLLEETQNVFFGGIIADQRQIYPRAIRMAAQVIVDSAKIHAYGFANLRFAALANVHPFTPFFPAAYHQPGTRLTFSLAMECADEALNAFSRADSLASARGGLLNELNLHAARLTKICKECSIQYEVDFRGFDFSLAPFPEDWCSLGKAFETLGLEHIGGMGSLVVAAFIANALGDGEWLKAGFNGLMLPVLEDSVLAKRAEEGLLSVKDLLLYSSVCGTGLDTVPLPGDTSVESLVSLLFDISALAVRLGKPLTARLMPVPGKKAGDRTDFDFGFFANSRVMALESSKTGNLLLSPDPIPLSPRKTNL
jgi:uncharacterized protein (UPF0210 family)